MAARRRNPKSIGCTLCGFSVKTAYDPFNSDIGWLSSARATKWGAEGPSLTGTGFIPPQQDVLIAPEDYRMGYKDLPPHELDEHNPHDFNATRCFIFHDACWTLLVDKVGAHLMHRYGSRFQPGWSLNETIVQRLFYIFASMDLNCDVSKYKEGLAAGFRCASLYISPCHASGRPSNFPIIQPGPGRMFLEEVAVLCADPDHVGGEFQPDDLLPQKDAQAITSGAPEWPPPPLCGRPVSTDLFSLLPTDLVQQILMHLPSADVANVRHASGYVSQLSGEDELPQAFWKTRFYPGAEMDFVMPLISRRSNSPKQNWRQIYHDVQTSLDRPLPHFQRLKNRQRIWKVLDGVAETIIPMISAYESNSAPWMMPIMSHLPFGLTHGIKAQHTATLNLEETAEDLLLSSRLKKSQSLQWPCDPVSEPIRLSVSRIKFNGSWLLSGIRVRPSGIDSSTTRRMEAGLVVDDQEEEFHLNKSDKLVSLVVLTCSSGITCIIFKFRRAADPENIEIFTVGSDIRSPGCTEHVLEAGENNSIAGFEVGMDACKMLWIQLILKPDASMTGSVPGEPPAP